MTSIRPLVPFVVLLVLSGCVRVASRSVQEVPPEPQVVESPLRAFLVDGSVVVFPAGAWIDPTALRGEGERYDLHRTPVGASRRVPLDSVLGVEAFREGTDIAQSLVASLGVTTLTVVGVAALMCAADPKCFGSCPTVYVSDGTGDGLEAELFSYSISPLLESRDLDRLTVQPDSEGVLEVEIRNEALETHYINHLELIEVAHGPDERVVPDQEGLPVILGPLRALGAVRDRDGRDVAAELSLRDGRGFASSPARIARAAEGDARDWIEFSLPPTGADSVALFLRARNSLLTTVLFYEFMLASQGALALDWMARDIEHIGTALELGSWYHRTMGLRVEMERDGAFTEVARLGDTGPIAWNDVAIWVPTRRDRPTRLRVSFLTDAWRIDELAWSESVAAPRFRVLPARKVTPLRGGDGDDLLARILEPDDRYLVTTAGTAFTVRFQTDPRSAGETSTFLLASQGYYTEWVRPDWIRSARSPEVFRPSRELIPALMARWTEVKGGMEEMFHATRIPVR